MKRRYRVLLSLFLIVIVIISSILFRDRAEGVLGEKSVDGPIYRVAREDKVLSLTFDINWAEKDEIYNILEVLEKYNVKATFFIMGGWVNYSDDNKEKLIKISEAGHEVGNHSYIHPMFSKIDENRMAQELEKTEKIIYETIGISTNLFRFPSGDYNEKAFSFVTNKGYRCIQWDVDSVDWKQSSAKEEYDRVMKKAKEGSILLFHNNAKYTPGNLDIIIKNMKDDGYSFITIGDMLYKDNYYIDDKGEQIKK